MSKGKDKIAVKPGQVWVLMDSRHDEVVDHNVVLSVDVVSGRVDLFTIESQEVDFDNEANMLRDFERSGFYGWRLLLP